MVYASRVNRLVSPKLYFSYTGLKLGFTESTLSNSHSLTTFLKLCAKQLSYNMLCALMYCNLVGI